MANGERKAAMEMARAAGTDTVWHYSQGPYPRKFSALCDQEEPCYSTPGACVPSMERMRCENHLSPGVEGQVRTHLKKKKKKEEREKNLQWDITSPSIMATVKTQKTVNMERM
jgi:hypothetical protein